MADPTTPGANTGFGGSTVLDPNAELGSPQTLHWLFAQTGAVNYGGGDINTYFNIDFTQVTPQATAPLNGSFHVTLVDNNLYLDYSAVPEPGSMTLIGIAGIGLAAYRRRKRRLQKAAHDAEARASKIELTGIVTEA